MSYVGKNESGVRVSHNSIIKLVFIDSWLGHYVCESHIHISIVLCEKF